uniref:T-box domain-containing protein n=1 Tax=Ciona savignyi TaxID=51511 RepID=H2ZQG2_CIOSA
MERNSGVWRTEDILNLNSNSNMRNMSTVLAQRQEHTFTEISNAPHASSPYMSSNDRLHGYSDSYISKFNPILGNEAIISVNEQHPPDFANAIPFQSSTQGTSQSPAEPNLQVELCDRELWQEFSNVGTEMIVTKAGRRMFPGYRVKISGMDPNTQYCVLMDIVNVDEHRYKFQQGEWMVAGKGELHAPQRMFLHSDSPATGSKWMTDIVSFYKIKLTNSINGRSTDKIVLNSMHRYQPRVHIVRTDDVNTLHLQPMSTFAFPQTVFITVTAYQNSQVTKLKINNNPFAKGFRDNGGRTNKNKKPSSDNQPDTTYERNLGKSSRESGAKDNEGSDQHNSKHLKLDSDTFNFTMYPNIDVPKSVVSQPMLGDYRLNVSAASEANTALPFYPYPQHMYHYPTVHTNTVPHYAAINPPFNYQLNPTTYYPHYPHPGYEPHLQQSYPQTLQTYSPVLTPPSDMTLAMRKKDTPPQKNPATSSPLKVASPPTPHTIYSMLHANTSQRKHSSISTKPCDQ